MYPDNEINALNDVYESLKGLNNAQIKRILDFKEIGEEIGQPSPALSYLMSKKPPLVIQTGTEGPGIKARRKLRVTEEGLRIAGNYVKE